jgi:hypothetical protein
LRSVIRRESHSNHVHTNWNDCAPLTANPRPPPLARRPKEAIARARRARPAAMETSLVMESGAKDLCLLAKKRFEHDSGVALKVRALLNTRTAAARADGELRKEVRLGAPPAFSPDDAWRPDPRPRLALGARASTAGDDVFFVVAAKQTLRLAKRADVVRGRAVLRSYTQAAARARYEYCPRTDAWAGEASAALSHAAFRLAADQDVRVSAGVRAALGPKGLLGRPEPFLRVQENCWSLTADARGWRVSYDL